MRKILTLALIISFFASNPALARRAPKVYDLGQLVDMQIEKIRETSLTTTTNISEDYEENEHVYKSKRVKNRHESGYNDYQASITTRPSTYEETTYFFNIHLDGVDYVTEYTPFWSLSHKPAWIIGDNVQVRFNKKGDRMYLLRRDGKELKTKVVKAHRIPTRPIVISKRAPEFKHAPQRPDLPKVISEKDKRPRLAELEEAFNRGVQSCAQHHHQPKQNINPYNVYQSFNGFEGNQADYYFSYNGF